MKAKSEEARKEAARLTAFGKRFVVELEEAGDREGIVGDLAV